MSRPRVAQRDHRVRAQAHSVSHGPTASNVEPGGPAGTLERLIFLSDGVFAIAMTLLVVQLTVPELTSGDPSELPQRLFALPPKYLTFAISFLVIATYWSSHQRIFSFIVRADSVLVSLNILLLLCIAFQPFPTNVLGTYGDTSSAVIFYAATLTVTGLVVLAMFRRIYGVSR